MKKQPKRFKNHFDKFPPILRQMVMEAMGERYHINKYGNYDISPLHRAFMWIENPCFNDHEFWVAIYEDAIYHKVWE